MSYPQNSLTRHRNSRERSHERELSPIIPLPYHEHSGKMEYKKPPTGPQKPARSMDRRKTISR